MGEDKKRSRWAVILTEAIIGSIIVFTLVRACGADS